MHVAAAPARQCAAAAPPHSARQPHHLAPRVWQRQRLGSSVSTRAATETEELASSREAEAAAVVPAAAAVVAEPHAGGSLAARSAGKRIAVLQATKAAALDVVEQGRPLADYMVLPASQYSVLDAQRIERLDEDTFCCYVGGLKLLGLEVEPVITVSVTVQERGPTVRLLSTRLKGSKAVEAANERFDATMTNVVRWQEAPNGASGKQIVSDTFIQVQLQVPSWFLLPTAAIERAGSAVMAKVLETAVPRFLQQLSADYAAWAAGDETRQPVGAGSILDDSYELPSEDEEQSWD